MAYFVPAVLCLLSFFTPAAEAAGDSAALQRQAAKSAAIVSILHRKAKKALVNAAQDNAFEDYFSTHDEQHRHRLKAKIDEISLNVQSRFEVEEMCLIDPEGSEISRIVGQKIAHDLSNEEASAPFFEPGFRHRPRSVFVSPVYLSPDADKWVIAYVTPVLAEGEKRAILHYEHGLDVYQHALAKGNAGGDTLQLAVTAEGWIVWSSRSPVAVTKVGEAEAPSAYFEKFELAGRNIDEFIADVDARRPITDDEGRRYEAAYARVSDWVIVALSDS